MSQAHQETAAEHTGGHVVPLRVLLLVWGALLALTWLTVSVTFIDLGNLNIVIALAVAVVKSSLVVLYFMHLRYDNPFNAFVFTASVVFVMLFIGFALIDRKEYAPELIPGYSPAMDEARAADAAKAGAPTTSAAGTATPPSAPASGAAGAAPSATPPSATAPSATNPTASPAPGTSAAHDTSAAGGGAHPATPAPTGSGN
jgi:cytochrome c oxidase subunit 4